MNEDLLHNILSRLPAKSFAFASCVNRSWNIVCDRIFSRPKMISAFSRNPNHIRAGEEVLDKVLSEPIRPHFVIANITCGSMEQTLRQITARVGSNVPIIVSIVFGILGKEARNDKLGEVLFSYCNIKSIDTSFAILLTIGYLPGIEVDVIPVIQTKEESETTIGDRFTMDIWNFDAPACLILFGEDTKATEPIIRKLDYLMPEETIIVGDQKCEFLHKRANESVNVELRKDEIRVLACLIFSRDRHRPIQAKKVQFHTAISDGISLSNLRYKAANVVPTLPRWPATLLTAKRIGEPEVLSGDQILDDIEENMIMLGNEILWESDPYIGVTKRRKYSGLDMKPKIIDSLVLHQVTGADEQYLTVNGAGIKTGDYFQIYFPNLKTAESSLNNVSSLLKNLKSKPKKPEVIGGFVFASSGRGDSFFGRPNADGSPFSENFPELPFGGVFSSGEIRRDLSVEERESSVRRCLHVYSSVYLIVSFTS
ncbi:unnamed protein product [Cochlearia groenlandica]